MWRTGKEISIFEIFGKTFGYKNVRVHFFTTQTLVNKISSDRQTERSISKRVKLICYKIALCGLFETYTSFARKKKNDTHVNIGQD